MPIVLFLTVPTAGTRPQLLRSLIDDSGLPRDRVIVIATRKNLDLPEGVVRIECTDRLNIQHWWNLGIEEAVARGATTVAVSNDDVRVGASTLAQLADAMKETGATLACPGPERLHVTKHFPFGRMLDGSLWLLDVRTGLRPDERFVWWFGDDDLDLRARRDFSGIVSLPVEFEHIHGNQATSSSASLDLQTAKDQAEFRRKYPVIVRATPLARPLFRWRDAVYLNTKRLVTRTGSSNR